MNNVKESIGWADYTINPVKGLCPVDCKDNQGKSYCYARRMYKRFKRNPEIRYENPFYDFYSLKRKKPCRVFIGSTIELFGDWIRPEWMHSIFSYCRTYSEHTFIFLTKQPQNLYKWSPFPRNCWVGVSATNDMMARKAIQEMRYVQANVRFLSLEPLLGAVRNVQWDVLNWVIIGLETPYSPKTAPKIELVEEIVDACDKAKIPVFLKNNLLSCWALTKGDDENMLTQEFPCV